MALQNRLATAQVFVDQMIQTQINQVFDAIRLRETNTKREEMFGHKDNCPIVSGSSEIRDTG
jgi:hypothetical protein